MKKTIYICIFLLSTNLTYAQLETAALPGTLNVSGTPNVSQTINDLVSEAGEDDKLTGIETEFDISLIGFVLDESTRLGVTIPSDQNCSENVFRYAVYMHTTNAPQDVEIQARTMENSGERYPENAVYDDLLIRPLGDRSLSVENGGNYITIPNDGKAAIKVFEFIGCRENIPIQFKIKPSTKADAGTYNNMRIFYTVVGTTL